MSLDMLNIKPEYRSLIHHIAEEFLVPALNEAINYDRAVGFFSSSILSSIVDGIDGLARNHGKIRLVASPYLSDKDIEAIRKGYEDRRSVIQKSLLQNLHKPKNFAEQENLNLLANLISDGYLDIKIAFMENMSNHGMYHEKLGLIKDNAGNTIAFSGSMNESETALSMNYETIDVFCSWNNESEQRRIENKVNAFEAIWNNCEPNICTIDFPEIKESIIQQYQRSKVDYHFIPKFDIKDLRKPPTVGAHIPEGFTFHDYQDEAIQTWEKKGYRGIFDMATGTGKTYTGLGAITRLSEHLEGHLAVVIVCPYQHLVEQWVEDIEKFNMHPIIGYSASSQKDWKTRLEKAIRNQKLGVKDSEFFCFICTNATYSSAYVQEQMNKIKGDCLFVVDEAHNFGAENLSKLLNENFQYRLALSATLERHHDEEGTQKLYDYFGEKCIEYTLERAINEGKLTRYKYYPVVVELTEDEQKEYYHLTKEIIKCLKKDEHGKVTLSERGKKLCLKRARLVAAAKNKIEGLRRCIYPYMDKTHILVYCGAASLHDYSNDVYEVDEEDLRQIDVVTDLLGNQLDMAVSQYTSKEAIEERKILKEEFARGEKLQALIAIKCLDEGVNIPSIQTAFILASTTNPKEYIQRRGRVLRLYEGKDFAEIYDFITLPQSMGDAAGATEQELNIGKSLIRNELIRAFEFARLADNYVEANMQLDEIRELYDISEESYEFGEEFESYVEF